MSRLVLALVICAFAHAPASAQSPFAPYLGQLDAEVQRWYSQVFDLYKKAFIKPDGRVFDPQNGGITHSESQGYGMMIALIGGDRETFDKIWMFTKSKMQKGNKLFGWKYVPNRGVTDWNNATDGELLIATALALAGDRWQEPRYIAEAVAIAEAVGEHLITRVGGYTVLLPGNWAEPSQNKRAATVNLSYIIPLTLTVMQGLAPQYDWEGVYADSVRMVEDMAHPPSDWSEVGGNGEAVPAKEWEPKFSYDAVRIPLYFLQGAIPHPEVSGTMLSVWGPEGTGHTFPFNVYNLRPVDRFWGTAFELTHDLLLCEATGQRVPWSSLELKMDNYFDSSLHIMLLAALHAVYPHCFPSS